MDGLIEHSAHRKTAQLRVVKLNNLSLNRTRRHLQNAPLFTCRQK